MTDDAARMVDDGCTNDGADTAMVYGLVAGERLLAGDSVKVSSMDGKVYRATQGGGYDFIVSFGYDAGETIKIIRTSL